MAPVVFGPDVKYQWKLLLTVALIGLANLLGGLAIAIPALVLYYIYVEKVERLVSEMDDVSIELVENRISFQRNEPKEIDRFVLFN